MLLLAAPAGGLAVETPPPTAENLATDCDLRLQTGDRVVLLGGTFVERLQAYGYFETSMTAAHADKDLIFRNLGWSGDNVYGESRALFGSPADGFQRLLDDVAAVKPTVILLQYGGNEAHWGPARLPEFVAGLNRLLDALEKTDARSILLSPHRYATMPAPLPDPAVYNQQLARYCDAMRELAGKRGLTYVDLQDLLEAACGPGESPQALTDNGVHLTQYGYWRVAPELAKRLGVRQAQWRVDLQADSGRPSAKGTELSDLEIDSDAARFAALDCTLPLPPAPVPQGGVASDEGLLRVRGLAPGNYELFVDGEKVVRADESGWAAGVRLPQRGGRRQVAQLQGAIELKNELFFHRYRPQNETYLFLFRKHEQGNNAVEIPQFDPLVEEQEQLIFQLRRPQKHVYELRRAD